MLAWGMEQMLLWKRPEDLNEEPEMVIEDHKRRILQLLMHNPVLPFNKLWNKEGRSNKFAYHMKVLEKEALIERVEGQGYRLTQKGKSYVTYLEGETGNDIQFPLMAVATVIVQDDKILMFQRKKEPFYGYWGFQGGKVSFSEYILECATKEILEETGLTCDVELKGLFSSKTFNNNTLSYNHQLFIVKATNPKGKLQEETREGANKWFTRSEIENLKILPNIPQLIEIAFSDSFKWVEADRVQQDGVFTGMDVRKDMSL